MTSQGKSGKTHNLNGIAGTPVEGLLDPRRRRVLQGLAGAGALAFAGREFPAWAQDTGRATESQLSAQPRVALVIGNSRYKETPLRNPANDASAIAAELKEFKFSVTLQLDARRQEMIEAIRAYGASLAQLKAVGLFYYAGHGAQLAWRNYLVPVDAVVSTAEEMLAQAVDMNALLDDLIRARNPMNIIILDACRDNPFGSRVALAQHGLSQLDAPVGTLLAYATSPGNVAADGAGENGLYTGFLLKEMQARDAKIEDVFKRVRLNVRRLSKGQQIPWESTSLEQDFYFLPAATARKLSPEEQEQQFEQELEIWQRIRTTSDPSQLEDYLRRFPSGKFCELAQFRLDRLLARQEKPGAVAPHAARPPGFLRVAASEPSRVAIPAQNPYTKGTAKADPDYQVGDRYTYSKMDAYSRVEENRFEERVTEVTDFEVTYNRGRRVTDLLGNDIIGRGGAEFSPSQVFVYEYSIGKKWTTRFHVVLPEGARAGMGMGKGRKAARTPSREGDIEIDFRVVGKESITVPAGTFDAFRVEGNGFLVNTGVNQRYTYWIAPGRVRRVLAMELIFLGQKKAKRADRFELVEFSERRGGTSAA